MKRIERFFQRKTIESKYLLSSQFYTYLEALVFIFAICVCLLFVGTRNDAVSLLSLFKSIQIVYTVSVVIFTVIFWKHLNYVKIHRGGISFKYLLPQWSQRNIGYTFNIEEVLEIEISYGIISFIQKNAQHVFFFSSPTWIGKWLKYHSFPGTIYYSGERTQ
jgi:hypothetical protein